MGRFCKNENCPPSQALLAFQIGEIEVKDSAGIRRHLCVCEFCCAEVEFYSHYPQTEEYVEVEEIPAPLYELAEALLRDKKDMSELYELIGELE